MATVSVARDPFARQELVRAMEETKKSCDFCGQQRKTSKLFRYGTESDSLLSIIHWDNHLFCSVDCYRHYHSI